MGHRSAEGFKPAQRMTEWFHTDTRLHKNQPAAAALMLHSTDNLSLILADVLYVHTAPFWASISRKPST